MASSKMVVVMWMLVAVVLISSTTIVEVVEAVENDVEGCVQLCLPKCKVQFSDKVANAQCPGACRNMCTGKAEWSKEPPRSLAPP
ncbi:hypothetical protein BVC80_8513g4 [Macleaya cordata]|uniref:Plant thionin family protein n=1 Tax=Macleaya cordata TaxID=56857 RepID=A0A200QE07_MACCD|nr:hypothetical protein BVC80_8513g4 [Macleaya cordata]